MSLRLDVAAIRQRTMFSCWWAAIQMVLRYYGRNVPSPGALSPAFTPPWPARPPDPFRRRQPWEWMSTGVPINPEALRLLNQLTGFRSVPDVPATWTDTNIEAALSRFGPMIFYGRWHGYPHAIVLTGADPASVWMNDPAGGCVVRNTFAWFNQKCAGFLVIDGIDISRLWGAMPIYYPGNPPVRGVRTATAPFPGNEQVWCPPPLPSRTH